jgi:SAM-dependent methyltransferase
MNFHNLTTVYSSIRSRGLLATFRHIYAEISLDGNIKKHTSGIKSLHDLTINRTNIEDCLEYAPSNPYFLDSIFAFISKNYNLEKMGFLDYGSGLGRALYYAHKYNFKKYVGIEFAKELCDKSHHFFKTQGITDINIINIDASKYRIDDDINIFYLFNSFVGDVLNKVLDNIDLSFSRSNRTILLVYLNPTCKNVVTERRSYKLVYNVESNVHNEVAIFERKPRI